MAQPVDLVVGDGDGMVIISQHRMADFLDQVFESLGLVEK